MEYKSENRICQNCKKGFTVEPDDFSFYEKIKVPPPTFCSECRLIRRMMWRNCRSLHKRNCGLCNKSLISMYSEKDSAPVYCTDCWNSGDLDLFSYGKDYDFSRPFFLQIKELFKIAPRFYAYRFGNLINSDYTNYSKNQRNVYMSFSAIDCEDVLYSESMDNSKNSLDSFGVNKINNCYQNIDSVNNYNSHYIVKSSSCVDSYFLYDCMNCSNCFMSSNLRNQQYVFNNTKMTKEAYFEVFKKINLGSFGVLQNAIEEFKSLIKNKTIHKYAYILGSTTATGENIHNTKNIKKCFDTHDSENMSYCNRALYSKDCLDVTGVGYGEMIYESVAATQNTSMDYFSYITILGSRECQYSLILKNCSNCFACVGLTNAEYCILNKQYSKEEYFRKIEEIKKHMGAMPYIDSKGRIFKYGEFFPYDMSPFGYNETNAHDFFPISKEDAIENGYNWMDREDKNYIITKRTEELPDDINDFDENILKEIIACPNNGNQDTQCTSAYKIVQVEFQFYKQKKLALPRFCPNCRHHKRLEYRNAMRLYHRQCMKEGCKNEFETSYAPDRLEKVYCESCYNKEVY
ncbi:MAG: hypothetical protein WCP17_00320 [bacterium]